MKFKIIVAAFLLFVLTNTHPAHAVEQGFLIGTWEMNTTMNGYMERGILTLNANGTGQQTRYALGQDTISGDFKWRMIKDGLVFTADKNVYIRLRIESFRTIILTPANASLQPIGPDLEYERQIPEEAITPEKPFTIIGLWQMTANHNGYFIHHVIEIFANGTGEENVYYSNAFGKGKNGVVFRWTYANNVITRITPSGEMAFANIRIVNRTHMMVRHVGGFPMMNGGEFKYQLQEHQNDEGCRLEKEPWKRLIPKNRGTRNKNVLFAENKNRQTLPV